MNHVQVASPASVPPRHAPGVLPPAVCSYVEAGRAFVKTLRTLTPADRAELRRDDPFVCETFWTCMKAAHQAALAAGVRPERFRQMECTLAVMVPLLALGVERFTDTGRDVGRLLHDSRVTPRRVEAVLTEHSLHGFIDSLEGVLRASRIHLDFGILLGDLIEFQEDRVEARRRWSRSLFLGFEPVALGN